MHTFNVCISMHGVRVHVFMHACAFMDVGVFVCLSAGIFFLTAAIDSIINESEFITRRIIVRADHRLCSRCMENC